ncbi:MAG: prolipoprotein diacylglyceryl transferase [Rhodospirillales bacterium]|mgnify:CR=1 FL=1|jgi:phosphatidylglycerol---prolipoprotein diacylglyceryl transferase|nr:prolipoprotein diacylglyceryl transferase [Rhodospirillales bacterium]MBT4038811.1 prolipoprotein diacylglyceryl transferase [Rhodospirillales bacterium]MBT4625910.1 prolipoprotein diacylglyceryl transferase [Rhodospirillales bacterium]MBT5352346.1 prolipoprotein diacylglyceryl transferase [Rhodospirillales bacterium]MBT6111655.1 prolipoprotein diacylglyceryl transferase [Rhodospirillales bacterium]
MFLTLAFPAIDPVLIQLGPFAIRWYSLAYMAGLILGWLLMRKLAMRTGGVVTRDHTDDFLTWATVGVILGGRLGYVLFYKFGFYLENPASIFAVWQGGMSFHGGFTGVVVATILFTRKHKIPLLLFADLLACAAPIGLFFGRIANFINGELFGRASDAPWAVIFPNGGPYPRHPSQLYEAALEGLVLFVILMMLTRLPRVTSRPGILTGVFMAGYGIARAIVEMFRQPDAHIGLLSGGSTMGQMLSIPMILVGVGFILYAMRHGSPAKKT